MADYPFPSADNDDPDISDKIVEYQCFVCDKNDPARLARFYTQEIERYTIGSKPWMAVPENAAAGNGFLQPMEVDDDSVKLVNRNEIAGLLDAGISRLIGSTQEPIVTPTEPTTIVNRAAKKSKVVLDEILKANEWTDIQARDADEAVSHGTTWLLAGWEANLDEKKTGPGMVLACDNDVEDEGVADELTGEALPVSKRCGWIMADQDSEELQDGARQFSGDLAREMSEKAIGHSISQPEDDAPWRTTLRECPECGGPVTRRLALPTDGDRDVFGYELTEETPLPDAFIEQYPDLDVFPIGGGRVVHGFMSEATIETLLPIDQIAKRYEGADEIEPMSLGEMEELARYHPSGLEMWGYAGHALVNDMKRWAVLRITIRQPFDNPKNENAAAREQDKKYGRLMISANRTVLINGPLFKEFEKKDGEKILIPRRKLFPFANRVQVNSVHGQSDTSRVIGPQQAIDATISQFVYDLSIGGSPTLAVPRGQNMEGQGDGFEDDDTGDNVPNAIIRFDPDAGPPIVIKPEVTHHDWMAFVDSSVTHMQRALNQSELDMGKSVTGAPSATAQMYFGQRLDETRKPKGQRWADRLSRVFSYLLDVVAAVYTDRRQFKFIDARDHRTMRDFAGADLLGQTTVKVTVRPAHDTDVFRRQNVIEGLAMKPPIIDLSTQRQRMKIAKILGFEDDIEVEPSQQVQAAENKFLDLMADGKRPIAKKRYDNHALHTATLMEDYRSPAGEPIRRMEDFHELATTGWYDTFKSSMLLDRRLKKNPTPAPMAMLDPATGGIETFGTLEAVRAARADNQLQEQLSGLPENAQERIQAIFEKMHQASEAYQTLSPADKQDLQTLGVFLACVEAHLWYEMEEQVYMQADAEQQMKMAASAPNPAQTPAPGPSAPSAPEGAPAL